MFSTNKNNKKLFIISLFYLTKIRRCGNELSQSVKFTIESVNILVSIDFESYHKAENRYEVESAIWCNLVNVRHFSPDMWNICLSFFSIFISISHQFYLNCLVALSNYSFIQAGDVQTIYFDIALILTPVWGIKCNY